MKESVPVRKSHRSTVRFNVCLGAVDMVYVSKNEISHQFLVLVTPERIDPSYYVPAL